MMIGILAFLENLRTVTAVDELIGESIIPSTFDFIAEIVFCISSFLRLLAVRIEIS